MEKDASREFMENLPELEPGKTFCFACHPELQPLLCGTDPAPDPL